MALTVGSRLGHHEVTAKIGEGGMGQTYRAACDRQSFGPEGEDHGAANSPLSPPKGAVSSHVTPTWHHPRAVRRHR